MNGGHDNNIEPNIISKTVFSYLHVMVTEVTLTRCKSRGNAEVDLAGVAIVLDESQPLDVLGGQLVFDGALDDHTLVVLARQARPLMARLHPLLPPQVREHLDRRVGFHGRNLNQILLVHNWRLDFGRISLWNSPHETLPPT